MARDPEVVPSCFDTDPSPSSLLLTEEAQPTTQRSTADTAQSAHRVALFLSFVSFMAPTQPFHDPCPFPSINIRLIFPSKPLLALDATQNFQVSGDVFLVLQGQSPLLIFSKSSVPGKLAI